MSLLNSQVKMLPVRRMRMWPPPDDLMWRHCTIPNSSMTLFSVATPPHHMTTSHSMLCVYVAFQKQLVTSPHCFSKHHCVSDITTQLILYSFNKLIYCPSITIEFKLMIEKTTALISIIPSVTQINDVSHKI
jgi:hypothetical protein